jgi:hypothetical protein
MSSYPLLLLLLGKREGMRPSASSRLTGENNIKTDLDLIGCKVWIELPFCKLGSVGQYYKQNIDFGNSKQEGIFLHYLRSQTLPAYQTQLRSMKFFVSSLHVVVLILFWSNTASKRERNEGVCFVPARNFCFCFNCFNFVF